jgi:hypothetical protein
MSSSNSHSETETRSSTLKIACPGCGAGLSYESGLAQMVCGYCECSVDLPDKPVFGDSLELGLDELLKLSEHEPLPEQKMLSCESCGATTSVEGQRITGRCAFCASDMVAEQMSSPNTVAPTALIPFKIDRESSTTEFRQWVGSLWFRPNALKELAKISGIEGIYVPFWTYDASTKTIWNAERGDYYYETESYTDSDGKTKTREVRKTRWTPCSGNHFLRHDDILVCGSRGLSEDLLRRAEPFNTKTGLVPYDPKFLAGWIAEEYAVGPKESWVKGKDEIHERERLACMELVPGDTHRSLALSTKLEDITWKHVLLPVWVAAYRYKGKSYRFLVNGETGEVSGESPLSWYKIGAALALYYCLVLVLALLMGHDSGAEAIFNSLLLFFGGLFMVGTPIALSKLYRSRNKSHQAIYEFYQTFRS